MSFVHAYDPVTGKKLPYLVPEHHIDHPILGQRLERFPSDGQLPAGDVAQQASVGSVEEAHLLKGEALDAALTAADLPTSGKADEKRARLVEHRTREIADLNEPPGGDPVPTDPDVNPDVEDLQTPHGGDTEN